jgi:hypothetical protein
MSGFSSGAPGTFSMTNGRPAASSAARTAAPPLRGKLRFQFGYAGGQSPVVSLSRLGAGNHRLE